MMHQPTGATMALPTTTSYQIGLFGEEVVCSLLAADGWTILERRARNRWGELDIVARRGRLIAFAEVKTANPRRLGPAELVGRRAQLRLRRAAVGWMSTNSLRQRGVERYRFDAFVVYRSDDGDVERIEHVADAF
jgi:putative endonuclease